jgi:hypothetical protein
MEEAEIFAHIYLSHTWNGNGQTSGKKSISKM